MSVDWPVGIATKQIAGNIVKRIRYSGEGNSIEAIALDQFRRAIQEKHSRPFLERWIESRRRSAERTEPSGPIVKRCQKALDLLEFVQEKEDGTKLIELFELLLGTTILRPLRSRAGRSNPSSLYWASIYHNLIDQDTVKSIMDSVIIPPGKGSAGEAIAKRFGVRNASGQGSYVGVQSTNSFGERQGVVEWQDLVLGQVSMLVGGFWPSSQEEDRDCSEFVASAFLPIDRVFDPTEQSANFLPLLIDGVTDRVDLICALCDEQASVRDKRRAEKLVEHGHTVVTAGANGTDLDRVVGKVADQLVPSRFLDRPSPMQAVSVAMPRSDAAKGFRLAHVALEDTLISGAISRCVLGFAGSFLGPEPLQNAGIESGRPTGCLLDLLPESNASKIRQEHVLEFDAPPDWDRQRAGLWILHTIDGQGWPGFLRDPALRRERLKPIEDAFHRLCRITSALAQQLPAGVLVPADTGPPEQAPRDASSRLGAYKLRRDVLCRYFNLLARVLGARDSRPEADQLRYILQAVLLPPLGALPDINEHDGDRLAQEVVNITLEIRELLATSLAKEFLALSSCAVLGANLRLDVPESQLPTMDLLECQTVLNLGCNDESWDPTVFWQDRLKEQLAKTSSLEEIRAEFERYTGVPLLQPPNCSPEAREPVLLFALRTGESETGLYEAEIAATATLLRDSHQASQLAAARTVESYARGAAHSLKNALVAVDMMIHNSPSEFAEQIETFEDIESLRTYAGSFAWRMQSVKRLANVVREQANVFFWMMDPKRALEEMNKGAAEAVNLNALVTEVFVESAAHAISRVDADEWNRQRWRSTKAGRLVEDVTFALKRLSLPNKTTAVERISEVLKAKRYRVSVALPSRVFDAKMSRASLGILLSVLGELFRNALKGAIRLGMIEESSRPVVDVQLCLISDHELLLVITNDATQKDCDDVRAAESGGGYEEGISDAMSGTWQLKLIETRLGKDVIAVGRDVLADGRVRVELTFKF